MNREIKFRGLRTDTSEWVYGYYVKDSAFNLGIVDVPLAKARVCHVIVCDGDFFHVKPDSVGQLIGRVDVDGKEIYEGDISNANGVIVFDERGVEGTPGFYWKVPLSRYPEELHHYDYLTTRVRIIGNVHEHPELL